MAPMAFMSPRAGGIQLFVHDAALLGTQELLQLAAWWALSSGIAATGIAPTKWRWPSATSSMGCAASSMKRVRVSEVPSSGDVCSGLGFRSHIHTVWCGWLEQPATKGTADLAPTAEAGRTAMPATEQRQRPRLRCSCVGCTATWPCSATCTSNALQLGPDLLSAAKRGDTDRVQELLRAGAAVDARDGAGEAPLHQAAKEGHTNTVLALLRAGAAVDASSSIGWTPLHQAAKEGHTNTVLALVKAGACVKACDHLGCAPLHFPALTGSTDTVLALLAEGAAAGASNSYGDTPLHRAAGGGHTDAALALLKARGGQLMPAPAMASARCTGRRGLAAQP